MPYTPNYTIALGVRPIDTEGGLDAAHARVASLRSMLQQQANQEQEFEANRLKIDGAKRQSAEYEAFKSALSRGASDEDLMKASPTLYNAHAKARAERKTTELAQETADLKLRGEKAQLWANIAGTIKDEDSKNRGVAEAFSRKLIGEDEARTFLNTPWSPEVAEAVQQIGKMSLDAVQKFKLELDAAEEKRKAELHPSAVAKGTADATIAQQTATGTKPIQPAEQAQIDRAKMPNTEAELAIVAADPNRSAEERAAADAALKRLNQSKLSSRPVVNVNSGGSGGGDAKEIAASIIQGNQPPDLRGLYRLTAPVRAELARNGYNLATAQRDWQATQRHLATLNGPQQERLRQAITFTYDSLDQIEGLYNEWVKVGTTTGLKAFNKASLATYKNLPGRPGEIATALEAQINDLTSELGTVYKGGNSSTDESLRLAAGNLKAEWNENTFKRGLSLIRKNLQIRRNSILSSEAVGVTPGSPYTPQGMGGGTPSAPTRPPLDSFERK